MNDKFDELAKGMAQSVTRRGALKNSAWASRASRSPHWDSRIGRKPLPAAPRTPIATPACHAAVGSVLTFPATATTAAHVATIAAEPSITVTTAAVNTTANTLRTNMTAFLIAPSAVGTSIVNAV